MDKLKIKVAEAVIPYLTDIRIVGVGTGSTVNCFIAELAKIKHRIDACVASSIATEARLRALGIPVLDLNVVGELPIYIDGADEVDIDCRMIKGGGGALTREKIIAMVAEQFICLVDESKLVKKIGSFAVAVEVLPLARSYVARELVHLGGDPQYRQGIVTDNNNIILDVFNLPLDAAEEIEDAINCIPGVVENGIFAHRRADLVMVSSENKGVSSFGNTKKNL